MKTDRLQSLAPPVMILVFLGLAGGFLFNLWGRSRPPVTIPPVSEEVTNTATVRMSAADLYRTDGDTSGYMCYACHETGKIPPINLDPKGSVILDEAHRDIVMRHGRNGRNNQCFICHDSKNLEQLRVSEGKAFKFTESSQLCGSCHGPTYRDWEAGVHGRISGFWDRGRGGAMRRDCTSCHDPHAPAFQSMKPAPGPHLLHPTAESAAETGKED